MFGRSWSRETFRSIQPASLIPSPKQTTPWGLRQAEATVKRARADANAARQRAADAEEAGQLLQEREAERAQASRVNVWESWVRWDTVDDLEPLPATERSITGSFRIVNSVEYGAIAEAKSPQQPFTTRAISRFEMSSSIG